MLRFGNVTLDVSQVWLRDGHGAEVALRPKSVDLLLALARNPGTAWRLGVRAPKL
jgi:DNA-binding response OmpR family regulator